MMNVKWSFKEQRHQAQAGFNILAQWNGMD